VGEEIGVLRIRRERRFRDKLRKYKVFVDGSHITSIREGQEIALPLSVGMHAVQLNIDWGSSPAIEVEIAPAGETVLICRGGKPGHMVADLFGDAQAYIELFPEEDE
jgi:hypothetical protein